MHESYSWPPRSQVLPSGMANLPAKDATICTAVWQAYICETEFRIRGWWAWVDLNYRPRPYQGLLWCYMHSSVAVITLLTTSISMSRFHMIRSDAEAVVTYMKSLHSLRS